MNLCSCEIHYSIFITNEDFPPEVGLLYRIMFTNPTVILKNWWYKEKSKIT